MQPERGEQLGYASTGPSFTYVTGLWHMASPVMRGILSPVPLSEQLSAGGLAATIAVFAADPPGFGARGIAHVCDVMVMLCGRPAYIWIAGPRTWHKICYKWPRFASYI